MQGKKGEREKGRRGEEEADWLGVNARQKEEEMGEEV